MYKNYIVKEQISREIFLNNLGATSYSSPPFYLYDPVAYT